MTTPPRFLSRGSSSTTVTYDLAPLFVWLVVKHVDGDLSVSFETIPHEDGIPDDQLLLRGHIKWDGCVNFDEGIQDHLCGLARLHELTHIMTLAYQAMWELIPDAERCHAPAVAVEWPAT